MKREFVFSEYERSRFEIGLGVDSFQVLFFVSIFFVIIFDYKTSHYYKSYLLTWGIVSFAFLSLPLFYGLKDRKYRNAQYEFLDQSVMIKIGRTIRSFNASDAVHISRKIMRYGERNAELQQFFWVLSEAGVELPPNTNNPYQALKKYPIIILPDHKETIQQLYVLFGTIETCHQNTSLDENTQYVFSDYERKRYKVGIGFTPLATSAFLSVYLLIFKRYRGMPVFIAAIIFWTAIVGIWFYVLFLAKKNKKYRFARYCFGEDAVSMQIEKEKRAIRASDSFHISLRTMVFPERYRNPLEIKYIVLWKACEPIPRDKTSPYIIMKRSKVIVLPDTEGVRSQLEKTFGVKTIGYWVTAS